MASSSPLRLGRIDYLNADPFFVGDAPLPEAIELHAARPTALNRALLAGELDASWISSVELLRNPARLWVAEPFCIAAPGPVRSVLLVSPVPLERLDGATIHVSSHSATSVALLQVALRGAGVASRLEPFSPDRDWPAGPLLLIGDEALRAAPDPARPFVLDLAEHWTKATGLPMVFAVLAVRRGLDARREALVDRAIGWMEANLTAFAARLARGAVTSDRALPLDAAGLDAYFRGFCYRWTDATRGGFEEFRRRLTALGLLADRTAPAFRSLPASGMPRGFANL